MISSVIIYNSKLLHHLSKDSFCLQPNQISYIILWFIFFPVPNTFSQTYPSFFLKVVWFVVNLLEECFVIFHLILTKFISSIQLATLLSKTGFLRRPPIVLINHSANIAPLGVKRQYLVKLFLITKSETISVTISSL